MSYREHLTAPGVGEMAPLAPTTVAAGNTALNGAPVVTDGAAGSSSNGHKSDPPELAPESVMSDSSSDPRSEENKFKPYENVRGEFVFAIDENGKELTWPAPPEHYGKHHKPPVKSTLNGDRKRSPIPPPIRYTGLPNR